MSTKTVVKIKRNETTNYRDEEWSSVFTRLDNNCRDSGLDVLSERFHNLEPTTCDYEAVRPLKVTGNPTALKLRM